MHHAATAPLTLDGRAYHSPESAETLGDLLADADTHLARDGRIVTGLRLDGVDEPAFREPHVVDARRAAFGEIAIESGTPADLAGRCLAEAAAALDALADAADGLAMRYRLGELAVANRELAQITEGIGTALAITGAASLGLGLDLTSQETTEGTLGALAASTTQVLDRLIRAQIDADWETTADLLEGTLAPVLRRWATACGLLVATPAP
ncbi:MAG: hypothetical protein ABIX28_02645 [Vicinamibacterales bacterium]